MSKTVIQVEHLSKAYRIGVEDVKSDTLVGAFTQAIKAPLRNFRTLRNLRSLNRDEASLFWALKDINFEVKEGEVLGIIGHNGAGKSTLLKILSRITEPTEGRIAIHGRVSSLLEVGTGFHPDLTGRENIYMNGTILGMRKKEIDGKLDEIISFSGISRHIDTPVKRYSSGMTVRLAFSVAAHLEPEILIVDEVLAVGDAEFQKKCLSKMEDVTRKGRTVLFVSHNMMAIKSICKTGILLKSGQISFKGTATDTVTTYLQSFLPQSRVEFSEQDESAQSERIYLKNAVIGTQDNDGRVVITDDFSVKILFRNKGGAGNFNVNLFFNAPDGTNIFVSASEVSEVSAGWFTAECQVNANILNDDFYNLDAMVVEGGKPIFFMKSVITVKGVEPPREGSWMGKFPGMVRPKFQWKLSSNELSL